MMNNLDFFSVKLKQFVVASIVVEDMCFSYIYYLQDKLGKRNGECVKETTINPTKEQKTPKGQQWFFNTAKKIPYPEVSSTASSSL